MVDYKKTRVLITGGAGFIGSHLCDYFISKNKIELTPEIDVDEILVKMKKKYANEKVTDIDGLKIDFENSWVHLRKSNTELIIRIYAEADSLERADNLAQTMIEQIKSII